MRLEKSTYACICVGPGGRKCTCCAPPSTILKRLEHRAARRLEKAQIRKELLAEEVE